MAGQISGEEKKNAKKKKNAQASLFFFVHTTHASSRLMFKSIKVEKKLSNTSHLVFYEAIVQNSFGLT